MTIKGLESVRHDTCALAKQTLESVISILLTERDRQTAIDKCTACVAECAAYIENFSSENDVSKLEITKMLSKSVDAYGEAKGQYHVLAARFSANWVL